MFDIFRKHTKILMAGMFMLIIPSFVLFGVDQYNQMGDKGVVVARVAGKEITQSEWDAAHTRQVDQIRASRPNLDAKMFDSPEARYTVLERLVRDKVLTMAAEKDGLLVSDARLARLLHEDPTIATLRKSNGKLDMEKYRQLAAMQGLTPEGFENSIRQDVAKQQVEAAAQSSGFASPATADIALNAFFEKREVQVASFLAADYAAKVNPTDAEIQAFYTANSALFQAPEQAKVEYVVLDIDAVKKSIKLADAELQSFYEQNVAKLSGTEERRASHILISAAKSAPAADREKALAKANDLLKRVRANPGSFAEVAKANSQDPGSAPKGGDLDFFARGAMVKPFEDAAFSLKAGDISDVVESDFGYHIIQLTEVKLPKQRSFEELRPMIENDLKTQQAQRKYAELAEVFTNTVYEQSDNLKPVAEKLGLEIVTVDTLNRAPAAGATGVLASEKFLASLFSPESLEKKRNTEALETAVNQLTAGRVIAYSPARTLPLTEVASQVREKVVAAQALSLAVKDGKDKLALWKKEPEKATLAAPVLLSRDQTQNMPAPLVSAVLRADKKALPNWLGVELAGTGYAVAKVTKAVPRVPAAQPSVQQEREQYAQWWTAAESQAYYQGLKERFKAEILVAAPSKNVGSVAASTPVSN